MNTVEETVNTPDQLSNTLNTMKKLFEEFRDFIVKGNLLQVAVAFIMGGAFGEVTKAFTAIITSLLGLIGGQPDFSAFHPFGIPFGVFINTIINLLIVGFCLFVLIKAYNTAIKQKPAAPAADPPEVKLLTEIRDLLKAKAGAGSSQSGSADIDRV